MPELPEVETIVRGLKKKVLGLRINNLWTDSPKMLRVCRLAESSLNKTMSTKPSFKCFQADPRFILKKIQGQKIEKIQRKGKNIIFNLSKADSLLLHQKLTGHLLYGKWKLKNKKWEPLLPGPLSQDPMNKFLHLVLALDNGWQLALSDLRKFAKIELWQTKDLKESEVFKALGPSPLEINFKEFKEALLGKNFSKSLKLPKIRVHRKPSLNLPIKQILMNQNIISGIGNIYASEILFEAGIDPRRKLRTLKSPELKKIYEATQKILKSSIKLQGESISDYRTLTGERGKFDKLRKVYRRDGVGCPRCGAKIKRIVLGGRSTYYCPSCQK